MNDAATNPIAWHDPLHAPFVLSGLAWPEQGGRLRRLPAEPPEPLPAMVDHLADHTAGVQLRFRTDASLIWLRVTLKELANMPHMAMTGQSGFDLYAGAPGAMRFVAASKQPLQAREYECDLANLYSSEMRDLTLNFPLYQGVDAIEIGLNRGARIEAPSPWSLPKPVVCYGTSITQGGCASRPGMGYGNQLSRLLNVEFINLGFSGSGKAEPEVARCIAGIDSPALWMVDFEANAGQDRLYFERLGPFLATLRERHPATPILVVSRIMYAVQNFHTQADRDHRERLAFQRELVERLRADGDAQIHFLDGSDFLGEDFDECTVDGVHPTDLGFYRMAQAMAEPIRRLLWPDG